MDYYGLPDSIICMLLDGKNYQIKIVCQSGRIIQVFNVVFIENSILKYYTYSLKKKYVKKPLGIHRHFANHLNCR